MGNYDDIASLDQAMRGVEKVLLISGTEQNRIQQHERAENDGAMELFERRAKGLACSRTEMAER